MPAGMAERYRQWFEYEKDSHAKVLAALQAAPEQAWATREFRKAVGLAGHIVASRIIWLFRLGGVKEAPASFFPRGRGLRRLTRSLEQMHEAWTLYLADITEKEIARSFEYLSGEGIRYRNRVEDILTQLYGHSLYHRGQIAMLLRAAGAEPAVTDFVFWTRTPIASRKRR